MSISTKPLEGPFENKVVGPALDRRDLLTVFDWAFLNPFKPHYGRNAFFLEFLT